jgi:hypothetical protein
MAQRLVRWSVVAFVLAGLFCLSCSKREAPDAANVTSYVSLRESVVSRIQKGEIHADSSGVATLPPELMDAATDAKVVIADDPNFGHLVAFKLSLGQTARAEYLLYAEHELSTATKTVKVGALELNVTGKTKKNWYRAIRFGR